jgi:hypothetical protein
MGSDKNSYIKRGEEILGYGGEDRNNEFQMNFGL